LGFEESNLIVIVKIDKGELKEATLQILSK